MPQRPVSRKNISWWIIIPIPILGACSVLLFYALGMPLKEAILENNILRASFACFVALILIRIALNTQNQDNNTPEN